MIFSKIVHGVRVFDNYEVGGKGADRLDHGLNVVETPELVRRLQDTQLGVTLCPWSYIRHQPVQDVFPRIRSLFDSGIKIGIGSR